MFGFIRSISFTVQAMIPVLAAALFAVAWFLPGLMQGDVQGGGLYHLPEEGWLYGLWARTAVWPGWLQVLPAFLAALGCAILLTGNDMNNLLMGRRSYGIAFVYLFLLASGGHFFLLHPAMLAGVLIIASQRFLLGIYKREKEYSLVLVMGFAWGAATLLYPPAVLLVPSLLFGMLMMVSTDWRHWLASLMGLVLPVAIAGAAWYLLGDFDYEARTFLGWFQWRELAVPGFIAREPFIGAWIAILLFWIVVASWRYRNPKIQSRQLFLHNFALFISVLVMTALLETVSIEFTVLLVIPVAYLMTFWALEVRKGWVRDLFFLSLLAAFAFFRLRGLVI